MDNTKYRIEVRNGVYGLQYWPQYLYKNEFGLEYWNDCGDFLYFNTEQAARDWVNNQKHHGKIIEV